MLIDPTPLTFFEDERPLLDQFLKEESNTFPGGIGDPAVCPANGTITCFDSTVNGTNPQGTPNVLSGPGNLEFIHACCEGGDVCEFDYFSFYVDGEGSPSIVLPWGHLFNCYFVRKGLNSGGMTSAPAGTTNFFGNSEISIDTFQGGDYGNAVGGSRKLFCPWTTKLKVTYTNTNNTQTQIWTNFYYRQGIVPQWKTGTRRKRLRQAALGILSGGSPNPFIFAAAFSTQNLCNIASGRGAVDSLTFEVWNNQAVGLPPGYYDGHVICSANGVQISQSSGTEDFFGQHFEGGQFFNRTTMFGMGYAGAFSSSSTSLATFYRFWDRVPGDSYPFDNGFKIDWTVGDSGSSGSPGTVGVASNVLYFTDH